MGESLFNVNKIRCVLANPYEKQAIKLEGTMLLHLLYAIGNEHIYIIKKIWYIYIIKKMTHVFNLSIIEL